MASTKITLPSDTWVDVTQGASGGTVTHFAGNSEILFVQAMTIPTLTPPRANPIADRYQPQDRYRDEVKYFGGLGNESIWALSLDNASVIVSTAEES